MDGSDREPESRGSRAAAYLSDYLSRHRGLSLGELAFRIRADKRDVRRLLTEQTIGWRLDERLAAYFGDDFVEAIYRPIIGQQAQRLKEIESERAAIAAEEARLASLRAARGGGLGGRAARQDGLGPSPMGRRAGDLGARTAGLTDHSGEGAP